MSKDPTNITSTEIHDASWEALRVLEEKMGEPASAHVFNNLKWAVHAAILKYLEQTGAASDAQRYQHLRSGLRYRQGVPLEDVGGRSIMKNEIRTLMEFRFWCKREQLDQAIDADIQKEAADARVQQAQ